MVLSRRVFVVDDDPSARNGLVRLLRTAGHDTRGFESADQFLEEVVPEASDCLVLDARMPGMSGEELQAELQRRGIQLPIIVISADDDSETRQNAFRMDAAAFFRKPVDGPALLDAIDWALRSTTIGGHHDEHEIHESGSEKRSKRGTTAESWERDGGYRR
jgi:FixJ family two-component response regulator